MSTLTARRFATTLTFTLALAFCSMVSPLQVTPARAEVVGNIYTSPNYDYTVTWDESWVVVDEKTEEVDLLILSNGFSLGQFIGLADYGGDALLATTLFALAAGFDPAVSDVVTLEATEGIPGSGGDQSLAYATISYLYTRENGTSQQLTNYILARSLGDSQGVLLFTGTAPSEAFPVAMTAFQPLLDSVVIPGQSASSDGATIPAALLSGEPAPVYMAGQWRISVATAAQNTGIDGIGLEAKTGKEWVAVVADVTNWGAADAHFPASEFFVKMEESSTKSKVATGSTSKAASALGLPASPDVTVKVGDTARLVLVFQVKAGRTAPSLVYGVTILPLDEMLEASLFSDALSAPAGPPELQQATLLSTADGKTIKVRYADETKSHEITLLGVDVTDTSPEAITAIEQFQGEQVWIEEDPAVTTDGTPAVYLWTEDDDGNRILLNQVLIADGAAAASPLPDDARFAAWLSLSEDSGKKLG
jgi:hypothetical protein